MKKFYLKIVLSSSNRMYYAGFDVGIKNLAFCVIDPKKYADYSLQKSNDSGIIQWVNINLLEAKTCCGMTKKEKECGKTASFIHENNYYCKTHKPEKAKKYKQKTTKNQSIEILMEMMFRELDNHKIFDDVTSIVIELQPRINPKMKTISNGLQSYFIIRQKIDNPESKLKIVKYSSAKNKLKVWNGKHITSPKTTKYLRTKDTAQIHTELILERDSTALEKWYLKSKKKDDLADAFLHAVWSLK